MFVLCSSDSTGNVIDLVKAQLPELQLSEEDRQKNLELLEQAKKVSDRFLTRRGRRSTSSLTDSPAGSAHRHTSNFSVLDCCVVHTMRHGCREFLSPAGFDFCAVIGCHWL